MIALTFSDRGLALTERSEPLRGSGEARIRPILAGVCATDLEIARGYMGFRGVLGHEFVGEVLESDDPALVARRVVGAINAACGSCAMCTSSRPNHCPNRTVLGILGRDGVMAGSFLLPEQNLVMVPDAVSNEEAVFAEPLAAACRITEQIPVRPDHRVAVLGDGRLGLLTAWVLAEQAGSLTIFGRHAGRMPLPSNVEERPVDADLSRRFDIVVDCTGSPDGLRSALERVVPTGTVVLKTTCAAPHQLSLAPVVIDEVTVVGSRCGPIDVAMDRLAAGGIPVTRMIDARYPLARATHAFQEAEARGVLKVLIDGFGVP